ncbi:MAG: 23S rRNA (cytosine1962-C5)-methyltransferase [Candidatus Promineifilaceae bacterium]|jgi:23S rRNA (cytosine1962-C5)-methyltransferase
MSSQAKSLETPQGTLVLKPKREKPLVNHHPWIFSGAIARTEGDLTPGDAVTVTSSKGEFLGIAVWNPASQIVGRIMTWKDEPLNDEYWIKSITCSIDRRNWLNLEPETNGFRLVNAESDGIPGLIVDRYDRWLVFQCLTKGIDVRRDQIINVLKNVRFQNGDTPLGIVERSDVPVRKKEGLKQFSGVVWGEMPEEAVTFQENGLTFKVDLLNGHKTGFYLDQREARALFGRRSLVENKEILNCFAYTGGFSVYAAQAGAKSIISVDSSVPALEIASENVGLNAADRPDDEYLAGNVFEVLRHYKEVGKKFDIIVLDPPKFANSSRDIKKAGRGYKDINMLSFELLRPGGMLFTFSCSGLISTDLFQKIVFGAAVDAGRDVTILKNLHQSGDHPVSLHFPEGHYLKGFVCEAW